MEEWEQMEQQQEMKDVGSRWERCHTFGGPDEEAPHAFANENSRRYHGQDVAVASGYLLPFLNALDFGEISISLYPYAVGVPPTKPLVNFMQHTLKMRYLYNAYLKSGSDFMEHLQVIRLAAPFYVRFHSSQAILISMLLGVPQQVFFAVLNPWESGLWVQTFMYSMVSIFLFIMGLLIWCCLNVLMKRQMTMPVSEAAVMWVKSEAASKLLRRKAAAACGR